ncbi:MAG: roadblock/LC7 domain-containing protein [Promethearchaeota archaeon]
MKYFEFTEEGLPIDSEDDFDKRIAAIGATLLNNSKKFTVECACGNLKQIQIHTEDEILLLSKKGENGLLTTRTSKDRTIN